MLVKLSAAILGAALAFGGSVAPAATPDASPAATNGQPTSLAVAVPLVAPASATGLISAENLASYTTPTGELTRQLNAVINRPVAIGIDPMIIASIRILGSDAPESAVAWLERLQSAGNETFALSYADSDIAALSQAGAVGILGPTGFTIDPALFPEEPSGDETGTGDNQGQGAGSVDESPSTSPSPSPSVPAEPTVPTPETLVELPYSLGPIAWPRENTVLAADLANFTAAGTVTTILGSSNVSSDRDSIQASASAGGNAALISHTDISQLLRTAVTATSDESWQATLSELTLALAGWTGGSSTVLATLDRTIPNGANRLAVTLDALASRTDVVLSTLDSAMAESPIEVSVVDPVTDALRVSRIASVLATEPGLAAFATVLDDPTQLTAPRRLSLLALSSNSWVKLSGSWPSAVDDYLQRTTELVSSVRIEESSTLNLRSFTGNLPIMVSNDLPYPVTVYVTVTANTAILDVLESRVAVVVEAESQARALIPVQSIANGDVLLQVALSSAMNVPISTPSFISSNVQAEWETAFTLVVVIVLLVIFVLGFVRTVTRRRRQRAALAAAPVTDAPEGPDEAPVDEELSDEAQIDPTENHKGD